MQEGNYNHHERRVTLLASTDDLVCTTSALQRHNSPIHLQRSIEGEQPQCEGGGVSVQVVAAAHHSQRALAVVVAEPVVKDSREAQVEAGHGSCMKPIWGSGV